jgi:hypothetical protein
MPKSHLHQVLRYSEYTSGFSAINIEIAPEPLAQIARDPNHSKALYLRLQNRTTYNYNSPFENFLHLQLSRAWHPTGLIPRVTGIIGQC